MGETKPSETKPKKMVSRNVAIALGIICIVLVASLVGTIIVLQNQVNNLNDILSFKKTMIWLSNETYTINPNENVSLNFHAPYSGEVRIVAYWQPANPNIWFNLSWGVLLTHGYFYWDYPRPTFNSGFNNYVDEEFPVASFGQLSINYPNVGIIIENNSADTVTTVNVTITLQH